MIFRNQQVVGSIPTAGSKQIREVIGNSGNIPKQHLRPSATIRDQEGPFCQGIYDKLLTEDPVQWGTKIRAIDSLRTMVSTATTRANLRADLRSA